VRRSGLLPPGAPEKEAMMEPPWWLRSNPQEAFVTPRGFTSAPDGKDDDALRAEVAAAIAELHPVVKDFSSNTSFCQKYRALIGTADRHAAKKEWGEAHQAVWEATCLVNRALETKCATSQRTWIAISAVVWLAVLFFLGRHFWDLEAEQLPALKFGLGYWRYLLLGALGGVTTVLFGLIKHTVDLDFDTRYFSWYLFKPVLGALMGLVAVLLILAGLVAIEGSTSTSSRALLCVVAFVAGFSERFSLRLLDKATTALLGGESTPSAILPTVPKPPPVGTTGPGD
jgi:hypothetical protein